MTRMIGGLGMLVLVVGLVVTTGLDGRQDIPPGDGAISNAMPVAQASVLLGTWEGASDQFPWLRVGVQAVHDGWASIRLYWGKAGSDGDDRWIECRAKLLDAGRFHIAWPFHMTFSLSEDHGALLGTGALVVPGNAIILTRAAADPTRLAQALPLPETR
jgi:hypothetical protein